MKNVRDIMTTNPSCCAPETPLPELARAMVANDCGCIPVLDEAGRPIGVVTDRDITCRAVALGKDTSSLRAADCMTDKCITVSPETTIDECCELLEANQLRRLIVVDENERCCGVVAQADIVRKAHEKTEEVLEAVSRPSQQASVPAGT